MKSDPVADLLTRIRNASRAEHEKVDIPSSKLKVRVCEILKDEGFIKNFRVLEDDKQNTLRVYMKYGPGNEKIISGLSLDEYFPSVFMAMAGCADATARLLGLPYPLWSLSLFVMVTLAALLALRSR